MNEKQRAAPPPGMNLQDVLYIVFRHKWLILTISFLGCAMAVLLPRLWRIPYESEAKLYIRYVLETRAPSQSSEGDARIKAPDSRGEGIINTELEILTSRDLAQQVAAAVGPERLLGKGASNGLASASRVVQFGVKAEVMRDSSVVRVAYQNEDAGIVQPVLSQLISFYFKKHAEIHAVGAFDEFLTQETDQLRSRLAQTEDELRKAKAKVGVISLADTQSAYGMQIARIQQELLDSEAELAARRAAVQELAKAAQSPMAIPTNETTVLRYPVVPPDEADKYRQVCSLLQALKTREQELLFVYTPSNSLVQVVHRQVEENQLRKQQLEKENPGLLTVLGVDGKTLPGDQAVGSRQELVSETARVSALEAKSKALTAQLDEIRKRAAAVAEAEGSISELQRRRDLEETHYRKFSENLAQSQLDERLGAGKVSNISMIEEPTPPQKAKSKLFQARLGLLLGSIAAALGLAFLIELYWDESIRRPAEVESRLGLPLFISIPQVTWNGHSRQVEGDPVRLLAAKNPDGEASKTENPTEGAPLEMAPGEHPPILSRYHEALRDRLIAYFDARNLTHKPKLVAVTSCGEGAGVSTTAAGLAASLSETGEGNVLLVNMNLQNGAAHHFRDGELACGLEDALETGKRNNAQVQDKLYVVSEATIGERLSTILPKRFKQLVPRLKASDFDYIIFDMPPVSQISLTPRLSRFMDIVLMVVESEQTDREVVKKASALLAEADAKVGVVLNKGRRYVPQWLKQEI